MKILYFLAFLGLFSCNQLFEKKVNEKELNLFFLSEVKRSDSTLTLEELIFIKLDTVTLKDQYYHLFNNAYNESKANDGVVKALIDLLKSKHNLQVITTEISDETSEVYKNEVDDTSNELRGYLKKDSLLLLDMSNIQNLLIKADSVKPVAYIAKCIYKIRKKDQSISRDTTRIALDLDFNILDSQEYDKQLNRLYTPVSEFKNK